MVQYRIPESATVFMRDLLGCWGKEKLTFCIVWLEAWGFPLTSFVRDVSYVVRVFDPSEDSRARISGRLVSCLKVSLKDFYELRLSVPGHTLNFLER